MLTINGSNVGDHVCIEQSGVCGEQVCPRVTINKLPDDVLLGIFEFYMAHPHPHPSHEEDAWHTLVHVCQRWRCVVFGSPRRLDLRLLCMDRRLVKTLDIWPELPIVIYVDEWKLRRPLSVTDVISLLKQHDRVCKVFIDTVSNPLLLEGLATTSGSFSALIEFHLLSFEDDSQILPDSFLGGSVPSLRSFSLWGIPFPTIGKLLSSTRDLVTLSLGFIRPSGFILPEAMVDILSTLTKLKMFVLRFNHDKAPELWTHGARQLSPALTRVVLPALTNFDYYGNSQYLEGIVSRIDAPLDGIAVTFSNQLLVSDIIPSFRDFIRRTKIPNGSHQADAFISSFDVEISLFQRKGDIDFKVLNLRILGSHDAVDPQLWLLAEACSKLLPPLPSLELLSIHNSEHSPPRWQDEVDNARWMELLRPFATVKDLVLDELVALSVASYLQGLVGEQETEVLPALQTIFLEGFCSSDPIPEGIAKFITARKLIGHPVFVHHRETRQ